MRHNIALFGNYLASQHLYHTIGEFTCERSDFTVLWVQ